MKRIQSKNHKLETYEIGKKSLSVFDDQRSVSYDGIHTLAYFHKDLKNRFTHMIINRERETERERQIDRERERFKKILTDKRDSKRFS